MKNISKIRQIMARDEGNRFLESSFCIGGLWGYRTSDLLDVVSRRGISQPRLDTVKQYIWNYKTSQMELMFPGTKAQSKDKLPWKEAGSTSLQNNLDRF